jgi:hypothetical protein
MTMRWLVRVPLVILIAAMMGWGGLVLMYTGSGYLPGPLDFWSRYVMIASLMLWLGLTGVLQSTDELSYWLLAGFVSPALGCLLVAPPASFAFLITRAYVAFPVGILTGFVLWFVFREQRRRPVKNVQL